MHNTMCLAIAACIVGMGATAEPSRSSYSLPKDPTKRHLRVQERAYDYGAERVGPFNFELLDYETGKVVSEKVNAAADAMLSTSGLPSSSKRLKTGDGVGPSAGQAQEILRKNHAETILPHKEQNTNTFNKPDVNTLSTLNQNPEAGTMDKGKAKFRESSKEDEGTASTSLLQKYMKGKADPGSVLSAVRSGLPDDVDARKKLVNDWAKYVGDYLKDNPMDLEHPFKMLGNEGDVVHVLYTEMKSPRANAERKVLLTYLQKSWLEPKLCDPADIYKRLGLNMKPIDFESELFREWVFHARYFRARKSNPSGSTFAPTLVHYYQFEGLYDMLNQAMIMLEQRIIYGKGVREAKHNFGVLKIIALDLIIYLRNQQPKNEEAVTMVKDLIESLKEKGASKNALLAPKLE